MPTRPDLQSIVGSLPESPGCYQYLDEKGTVIYVGKAKNLRRRVGSYFRPDQPSLKTRLLVSKIRDIKYVVVNSETDALLLENNLIKRYKPHYNVLLKDDKTYPSIALTQEWLPRLFPTRNRTARGATYFGPYSHVPTMKALLELCRTLYQPRPCRTPMSEAGVKGENTSSACATTCTFARGRAWACRAARTTCSRWNAAAKYCAATRRKWPAN